MGSGHIAAPRQINCAVKLRQVTIREILQHQVVQIERIILISKYLYNFHYEFAILSFREINPNQQL